ncbi:DUF429 domain-containing protein [Actimicrobium antarcticum]|uniref:DUF429 domain-containing protein n=1 Tax=Actimicrobium antarcticum TaxID=1051899 RepID=A0ABP7SUW3_9BURK
MTDSSTTSWLLHGVDFTSAPSKRKTITIASGRLTGDTWRIESLHALTDFASFSTWLEQPGPWLGAFDFPFSLPRELVEQLGWPTRWVELMTHLDTLSRGELRTAFKGFCDARPVGNKFAHRATDGPAGSSSSMKWVNPPVAYMLHAGVPLLRAAGVSLSGMHPGDPTRIALEGYPGMVARSITAASYKNDDRSKQTPQRRAARAVILDHLDTGNYRFAIRLDAGDHRDALLDDATGDLLDAALCGLLAAWAWQRRDVRFGLPEFDVLEGWIVGA